MSRLVVFYSLTGHGRETAQRLAETLRARLVEVVERRPRATSGFGLLWSGLDAVFHRRPPIDLAGSRIADGDEVVFCFPVWAGQMAAPARTWLAANGSHVGTLALAIQTGTGKTFPNVVAEAAVLAGREPAPVVTIDESDYKTDAARQKALGLAAAIGRGRNVAAARWPSAGP